MLGLLIDLRMLAKNEYTKLLAVILLLFFKVLPPFFFISRHKDVEFVIPGSKRMSSSTTCLYQGTYNAPGSSRRNSQLPINVSGRIISIVCVIMIINFKTM